jgi:hypothetical protein
MAYFSALGGTGGTSATITVTYSEDFYGLTITATNGTTTLTKTATSSGTLVFDVSEGGTWVVSGTVEGATYSESVDVTFEYTAPPLVALPDGSTALPVNDIQMWLKCAAIRDKTTYTTLSDVLADTETLIALCADSNACDYMARSTNWASGVAADSTAMLIVGKYNYCANALLDDNTWETAIRNSPYSSYVDPEPAVYIPLVPVMTSNTTPSGECISISEYSSSTETYLAFDGDAESTWTSSSTTAPVWIGYEFPQAKIVNGVKLRIGNSSATNVSTTFKLQYSDTGNSDDWTDIGDSVTTTATTENLYTFENSTAHLYYRIYISAQTLSNATYKGCVSTLQFCSKQAHTLIHSAVEDSIFYMDDGSPVALCGIPVGDTIDVDLEAYKGQTLTLVSTVAKDPTNLSNDFSMNVRITPNITEIYLMPVKELYWYGYIDSSYQTPLNSSSGWAQIISGQSTPTFNTQNIYFGAQHCGVGFNKLINASELHCIAKAPDTTNDGRTVVAVSSKANDPTSNYVCKILTNQTSVTHSYKSFTQQDVYVRADCWYSRYFTLYAVWLE